MSDLKFKRNESFYIRDGWFQKAIHGIHKSTENIFLGTRGVDELGIGSNMVKSLKYWLSASKLIEATALKCKLSPFGELVLKYDAYLETSFTWFLIHYHLVLNHVDTPIFNLFFNKKLLSFNKDEIIQVMINDFKDMGEDIKDKYVADDFNVFLKSYIVEDKEGNPEDNYICPLSSLNLIEKKKKDSYITKHPRYSDLSYLIVYYALLNKYKKQFNIEDALYESDSPIFVFNLDKNMFLQYLDEMRKNGLITINKTAGLNTVYLNERMSLENLFERRFGK